MSISPASDLILDVIRAADPRKAEAAAARLQAFETSGNSEDFRTEVRSAASRSGAGLPDAPHPAIADERHMRARKAIDPLAALGSLVLQQAIEQAMPKNSSWFGPGTAASTWRSTMAQQIAETIAPRIFRPAVTAPPEAGAATSRATAAP